MKNYYILSSGRRCDNNGVRIPGDPAEAMHQMLTHKVWGGNEDTPNFMGLEIGDRVIVQSADEGFVAICTVKSAPRRTRRRFIQRRNCTHEVALTVRMLRRPIMRSPGLREDIAAVDCKPHTTSWSNYFICGIKPICREVFDTIQAG